ncbi:hypothetical protein APED_24950 [Acanthopleuribacter pedis]
MGAGFKRLFHGASRSENDGTQPLSAAKRRVKYLESQEPAQGLGERTLGEEQWEG